jgi:hypothetical protein
MRKFKGGGVVLDPNTFSPVVIMYASFEDNKWFKFARWSVPASDIDSIESEIFRSEFLPCANPTKIEQQIALIEYFLSTEENELETVLDPLTVEEKLWIYQWHDRANNVKTELATISEAEILSGIKHEKI